LCNCARNCCSWRRITSEAVFTKVWKADTSSGLGFFLSRPMVQGPTSAGSASPFKVMATAQPSSSSFLMTCAVQRPSLQQRGSWMVSGVSGASVMEKKAWIAGKGAEHNGRARWP